MFSLRSTSNLVTVLALFVASFSLTGTIATSTSVYAQSGCGAAMPEFQSAMRAGTAEALTSYLEQHAPCFEAPARARLDALGGTRVEDAAPEPQSATAEEATPTADVTPVSPSPATAEAPEPVVSEAERVAIDIEAGPLWNNDHAREVCPQLCSANDRAWTGH